MNEANTIPNLFELAAPYEVAGALPEDIPVSVALIAETSPRILHRAVVRASSEHGRNVMDAGMDLTRVTEESVEDLAARANNPQQEQALFTAREELIEAMVERANAALDLPRTLPMRALAGEIQNDIERLGRRGRLTATAAGLLLGAGLGLGLATSTMQNAESIDTTQSTSQNSVADELPGTGLVGFTGGVLGFAVGSHLVPRFAQRRAAKQLKKARNV